MGYHIILKHDTNGIQTKYVEKLNDLADYPITKDTIVYQGEKHWVPELVKNNENYKAFAQDWHRAGIKAQGIFKEQAIKAEYILEDLSQDQDSFKAYTSIKDEYLKIKRGDFLIRNVKNLEVDVKCRKFFYPKGSKTPYFEFNSEHLERHLNMYAFTKTPIIIAVYRREENTDNPIAESLVMVDVLYIKKLVDNLNLKAYKRGNGVASYKAYQIPVEKCMTGFKLIEYYRDK